MALVSSNQFQLGSDLSGAVGKGINAFQAVKSGQARDQQLGMQKQQFAQQQQLGAQQIKAGESAAEQKALQLREIETFNAASQINNLPNNELKHQALRDRKAKLLAADPNANTTDTDAVLRQFDAGDFDTGNAILQGAVNTGIQQKYLAAPAQQKAPAKFEQVKGGLVFNPNDGSFAINPVAKERFDELAVKAKSQGGLDFKDKKALNKDVTGLLKETVMINNTAKDLEKLGKVNSGPASIALVFKFMKALDPTSVVREGEFATAENSAGIPEGVRNIYNKFTTGERLGDKQIQEFIDTAKDLSNSAASNSELQVGDMLNTFGNTIPDNFKSNLMKRIPKQFETKIKSAKDLANLSDNDLLDF